MFVFIKTCGQVPDFILLHEHNYKLFINRKFLKGIKET